MLLRAGSSAKKSIVKTVLKAYVGKETRVF